MQVFLEFVNFYRRFIYHYSQIASLLTGLLKRSEKGKKSEPFEWLKEADQAFYRLQAAFTSAPLLRHFDLGLPIQIEMDVSEYAIAGILTQLQESNK